MANDQNVSKNKRAVVGIEKFAHQKGVVKALHEFRERKEKKRLATAKSLRGYRKAMKKAGYEAGTGASRKRKHQQQQNENVEEKDSVAVTTDPTTIPIAGEQLTGKKETWHPRSGKTKKTKMNALRESQITQPGIDASQGHRSVGNDREGQAQHRPEERKQALRRRRQRHERLAARTSKGQPIMKNIVHDILEKLKHDKNQTISR